MENRNFYPILQYSQISRDGVMCKKERWKKKANAFFGIFPFFEAKPKFYGETIFLKKLRNFNFKVRYLRKGWSDIKFFCKLPTIVFYLQIQKKLEKFSKFRNKFEIAIFGPKNQPNCQNCKVLNLKKEYQTRNQRPNISLKTYITEHSLFWVSYAIIILHLFVLF